MLRDSRESQFRTLMHDSLPTHTSSGLYSVTPASGSIAAGVSDEFTLRFSPAEVEDCERLLVCDIPDLDTGCQPLARAVAGKVRQGVSQTAGRAACRSYTQYRTSGGGPLGGCPYQPGAGLPSNQVLRPWCHFELPDSDYITGGRRNPEQPGPSGAIEPLDPGTKVRHTLTCDDCRQLCLGVQQRTGQRAGQRTGHPTAAACVSVPRLRSHP